MGDTIHSKSNPLNDIFETYCLWRSLPRQYCNFTDEALEKVGITDPEIVILIKLKNTTAFAKKFGVSGSTVYSWDKTEAFDKKVKDNWKKWAKRLTPNLVGKLYTKALEEGDIAAIKLWKEWVEGEAEGINVALDEGLMKVMQNMKEDEDKAHDGNNSSDDKSSKE